MNCIKVSAVCDSTVWSMRSCFCLNENFYLFFLFTYLFTVGLFEAIKKKKKIGIWLIYNVLASGVQPSDSVIHISTF